MVVALNRLKSRLKQYAKKGKSERRISKGRTVGIEKMIHEVIAEKNSSYIKGRLEELSKEDKYSVYNFWKIKKKFYKRAPQNKCSIVNHDNLELYMPEQIVSEFRKEFQTRLTERKIHPAYKNIERLVNEIFERCHNESKVKNEEKDFTLKELKQVAKTFRNGQSRDLYGYVNELFKNAGNSLLLSLLFMLNEIKRLKTIPEQ